MDQISSVYQKIKENIARVIVGKQDTVDMLMVTLLCGGHLLLEDVPGTGKTMLIKSLAASVGCDFKRIQFTPDLLPSDITGINFFNMKKSEFEFIPGPIFAIINLSRINSVNRLNFFPEDVMEIDEYEAAKKKLNGGRKMSVIGLIIFAAVTVISFVVTYILALNGIDVYAVLAEWLYKR